MFFFLVSGSREKQSPSEIWTWSEKIRFNFAKCSMNSFQLVLIVKVKRKLKIFQRVARKYFHKRISVRYFLHSPNT